jgi:hypothetical protein
MPGARVLRGGDQFQQFQVAASLKAFKTHWDKSLQEFALGGAWAFERSACHSHDTPVCGGPVVEGTAWSLVLDHHDADGQWCVARDPLGAGSPG